MGVVFRIVKEDFEKDYVYISVFCKCLVDGIMVDMEEVYFNGELS